MASIVHVEQMVLERSRDTLPVVTRISRTWYRWSSREMRVLLRDYFHLLTEAVFPPAHYLFLLSFLFTSIY